MLTYLVSARTVMDGRYVYFLIQTREPLRSRNAEFDIDLDTEHGINPMGVRINSRGASLRMLSTWMAASGAQVWWGDVLEAKIPRWLFGDVQHLNLGAVRLNYSVDGAGKTDWMYAESLFGHPDTRSNANAFANTQVAIVIDGNPDDWAAVTQPNPDRPGSGHTGSTPGSDLVTARVTLDDAYIYLLVEAAGDLITGEVELDIELDVHDGVPCSNADVGVSLHPNGMGVWMITGCHSPDPHPVQSSILVWGNVVEVQILKSELGDVSKVAIVVIHLNMAGTNGWFTSDDLYGP